MEKAIQNYLNFFKQVIPELTHDELEFIKSKIVILKFKKKQVYVQHSIIQNSIGYVYSGLIRSYFIDKNGKEVNTAFYYENEFAIDYVSFINKQRTKYTLECIEDSVIVSLSYDTVQEMFKNYKNFANLGRKVVEWALEVRTNKFESFLYENAEERYLRFILENPTAINRISLMHISSYLGIERQSLSRIRSKILSQK